MGTVNRDILLNCNVGKYPPYKWWYVVNEAILVAIPSKKWSSC